MNLAVSADLKAECEAFLFREAEYLDERLFRDWLGLLADEIQYEVPIRVSRGLETREQDFTRTGFHMKDDHATLAMRVERLYTGHAYAESPASRTTRLVTNVRVKLGASPDVFDVRSNFACYRAQGESVGFDLLMGERIDVIRRVDSQLKLAARRILLAHTTLPTANLGLFL